MSLSELPDEIIIHIFSFIDCCPTLARCGQVSRRFRNIAAIFQVKHKFWKDCCLKEISEPCLLDLSGKESIEEICHFYSSNKSDPECENTSNSRWEELYRIYKRTWIIGRDGCKEMSSKIQTNRPVSCLKINGDYVAVGCYYGTLSLWDHLTGSSVIDCYANSGVVTNLELIDEEGIDLPFPPEKEGLRTRMMVTGGVDRYVVVHVINMTTFGSEVYWKYECADRILHIRVFGHTLVVSAMDSFLAGIRVMDVKQRTVMYHLYGHQSAPTAIAVWKNQVLCGGLRGELFQWEIDMSKHADAMNPTMVEDGRKIDFSNSYRYMDLILKENVVICLTGDRDVHVGRNGEYTRHYLFHSLSACPQILKMRGNLLAIGTSAGTCAFYHVPSLSEISTHLSGPALKTVHTGEDNVRDVDIWDDGDGPMAVLATDGPLVTVVRWYL